MRHRRLTADSDFKQLGLRGSESGDGHARAGTRHVVDADAVTEVYRSRLSAVLTADA
jgi:hypothetical protein